MSTATLTPTQRHLLKLFSYNSSEAYAREIQAVLTKYFQNRLDAKSDELWDNGILDQKRLDEISTGRFNTIHVLPISTPGKIKAMGTAGSVYAPRDILEIDPMRDLSFV